MRQTAWFVAVLGLFVAAAQAQEAPPAPLRVRFVRPDRQCEAVLRLFDGTRAAHPAAALAAWRKATHQVRGLGKTREAIIALFNPQMVPEWRLLDGSELALGFEPAGGELAWWLTVPRDDGTAAALATALALTDGGADPPVDGAAVDRLGPPGAPLMARGPGKCWVAASSRGLIQAALAHVRAPAESWPAAPGGSGWLLRLDLGALARAGPLPYRQLAEGLRALGVCELDGAAGLQGQSVRVELSGLLDGQAPDPCAIDPAWLDFAPISRTCALWAIALDPSPRAWDLAFAALDRAAHADPRRAAVAPLRTRLNLLALPAKIDLERDVWPRLRGFSGAVVVDAENQLAGALFAVHAVDSPAAARLADQVVPALAAAAGLKRRGGEVSAPALPGVPSSLGAYRGKPLSLVRHKATVLLAWGDPGLLNEALDAAKHAEQSPARVLKAAWGANPPQRAGAFWLARMPRLALPGSALAAALADAPPVIWCGRRDGGHSTDLIKWNDLRATLRRFLDRLPMEAP